MRIGIDSYSYHRRYGEVRPDEDPRAEPAWEHVADPVLDHARGLGVDAVFLETCYLPAPETIGPELAAAAAPLEVGFSWGHPWPAGTLPGLDGGRSPAAEDELARWVGASVRVGQPVLRITAGSPASRGSEPAEDLIARLIAPLARAADTAAATGVALALENHGDLRARDLVEILARVDRDNLGITLDSVNLIRVGDDMLEGTRLLAPHTLLVQLKDHAPGDPTAPGGPRCTALGEGIAPLDAVIAILADAGYDGAVCVELASLGPGEVDELALIERSVTWLREHVPA